MPIRTDQAEGILRRFLADRGWSAELVAELGLAVVVDRAGRPRVRFPFRLDGDVVGWSDRAAGSGHPKWLTSPGPVVCPYEADRLARAHQVGEVFVVEGITDTVALIEHFPAAAVVGIPGSGGFKKAWADAFSGLVVFCVADNDEAGERMRGVVDRRLDGVAAAVWHVRVPGPHQDLDEWARASREAFEEELLAACSMAQSATRAA